MNRVLIGFPSGTSIPIPTFGSLTNAVRLDPPDISENYNVRGTNAVTARNNIIWKMYQGNFTHVFFADSDMVFPAGTLQKLLNHDVDIVGGYYVRKRNEFLPTAFKLGKRPAGLWETEHVNEFKEVEAIGTGCLLVKRIVFDKVGSPWFEYRWTGEATGKMVTEDMVFCEKAKERGFKIYCDGTIKCGHVNMFIITPTEDPNKTQVTPV